MCYSLRYKPPTMLLAGRLEAEALPLLLGYRPSTSWVHYITSCNTQSSAPDDGQNHHHIHIYIHEGLGVFPVP